MRPCRAQSPIEVPPTRRQTGVPTHAPLSEPKSASTCARSDEEVAGVEPATGGVVS